MLLDSTNIELYSCTDELVVLLKMLYKKSKG